MSGAAFQMRALMDEANRLFVPIQDPPDEAWARVAQQVAGQPDADLLWQMLGIAPLPWKGRARKETRRNRGVRQVWTHNASGFRTGCRCDICREAIRDHRRTYRPPVGRHGTESAYKNSGCRCELCRQAASAAARERRLRKDAA